MSRARTCIRRTRLLHAVVSAVMLCLLGCARSPEQRTAKFLESGKHHLQNKDYARAILQFKNASQSSPRNPEPYYQAALAYEAAGDLRSSVANLKKAIELDPKHTPAQLNLAELMATRGDDALRREAEQRVKNVLTASPGNSDALRVLALAEIGLGKLKDAEGYLQQSLDKFPANLQTSVALARVKVQQNDLKAAEQVLQQAVARSPGKPDALLLVGSFYLRTNRPEDSRKAYERALECDPSNSAALLGIAALQDVAGQRDAAENTLQRLSTSNDVKYRVLYGIYLFGNGKYDAAIAEFERQVKRAPEDRGARSRLVSAYLNRGRNADAEHVLAGILKKNPKDIDAALQQSAVYLYQDKYAEAESDLDRVIRYRPESAQAHLLKAMVHQARGETGQEKQEVAEALKYDTNLLQARLHMARLYLGANDPKAAVDVLDRAPETQKKSIDYIVQRNWALLATGAEKDVGTSVSEALKTSRMPELLLQDGLLRIRRQDYEGARASLQEALKKAPEDLRSLNALASSYLAQKQREQAVNAVLLHTAQYPRSAQLQYFAGQSLVAAHRGSEARQAFLNAKAADPKNAAAEIALANLDISEGKTDSARDVLTRLSSTTGPSAVQAHTALGLLEHGQGNGAAALDHFRKAAEMSPHDASVLNNLAFMLVEQKRADEALPYAQQAGESAPNNPAYSDTLGWVFYHKGLYTSAIEQFEAAVSRGGSAVDRYHLAMAYIKSGDLARGRRTLDAALKSDPNIPEAAAARQVWDEASKAAQR